MWSQAVVLVEARHLLLGLVDLLAPPASLILGHRRHPSGITLEAVVGHEPVCRHHNDHLLLLLLLGLLLLLLRVPRILPWLLSHPHLLLIHLWRRHHSLDDFLPQKLFLTTQFGKFCEA